MDRIIAWSGTFLMLLLFGRLTAWRAWRIYPFFFWFFAFLCFRVLLIDVLEVILPREGMAFGRSYWYTSLLSDVLKFTVAAEIFRKLTAPRTMVRRLAGGFSLALLLALAALYAFLGVRDINIIVDAKVNLSFATAIWIFATLGLTHYYRLAPSLNTWGIALGTGLFAAFTAVNFAALGIEEAVYPTFKYVLPLGFVATLLLWLLTLWSYHAPPILQPASAAGDSAADAVRATGDALRKALGMGKK